MKYYRAGVHTLVDLLYSPEKILDKKADKGASSFGSIIHFRLGYVGSGIFKKYYTYKDYLIEIIGSPDKVNYSEGCVEELKTYSSERSREIQKERGRLQLIFYSWLTGLKCARLVLYDVANNKIELIYYNFTEKEISETLEKAVRKYVELRELLSR